MATEATAVAAPAAAAPAASAPAAAPAAASAAAAPAAAAPVAVAAAPAAVAPATAAREWLKANVNDPENKLAAKTDAEVLELHRVGQDAITKAAAAKAKAPESYADFKAPDGVTLHVDVVKEVKGLAKELDLSQADAQKLIDKIAPAIAKSRGTEMQALVTKTADGWRAASLADPELGGDKAAENLAVANKTFDAFGTPALREVLNKTGLGDHPELLRWAFRIGKQIGPDGKFVSGATAPNMNTKPEDRLWPDKK